MKNSSGSSLFYRIPHSTLPSYVSYNSSSGQHNIYRYKIPTWFLNRQRDIIDGKDSQILANGVDSKLREDLERLKKIRAHRGLRHFWGLRVRGQHSKTTGRRGRTVGVSKKKG